MENKSWVSGDSTWTTYQSKTLNPKLFLELTTGVWIYVLTSDEDFWDEHGDGKEEVCGWSNRTTEALTDSDSGIIGWQKAGMPAEGKLILTVQ